MSPVILAALLLSQALEEARAAAARGDFESAKAVLEKEVAVSPTAEALAFLSQLQVATDAIPQGAESLARALELAPDQYRWRTTLGALYYRLGKLDEAERELARVVSAQSPAPVARYYLAAVEKARGNLTRAEENARLAAKHMPDEPVAASLPRLDFSLRVNARYMLAEIEVGLGRNVEESLSGILQIEPTHPGARYLLARSLLKRGMKEEGRNQLAIFERAKRAQEHLREGLDFSQAGNHERAVAEYRRALEAYPDHPRALYFLARELVSRSRIDEAQELLWRLLEIEPNAAPLVEALRSSK
jgi:tetratricopeptide (TPR) repeat protein